MDKERQIYNLLKEGFDSISKAFSTGNKTVLPPQILAKIHTVKGEKGDKGDKGDSIKGDKGDNGEKGDAGKDGVDGKDSTVPGTKGDSIKGDKGDTGENGKDGVDGKDGKDGSPDTGEQIIDKLVPIKKAWIPMAAIDGDFNLRVSKPANNFYNKRIDDLVDVDLSGLTITNGKYILGSGGGAGGTVTSVSVTTANGVSGTVATATTTPAISLTLGAITPTSINGVTLSGTSTPTLAVTGTTTVSGTNTGDNTIATALTGTPSITVSTVTTTGNIELGHASDTTLSRSAAGVLAVEGVNLSKDYTPPFIGIGYLGGNSAADVVTANYAWYQAVDVHVPVTVTGMRIGVAASSGNICVGLYNSAGTRLATSGSVACPAANTKATVNFSANATITPGTYYLALAADNIVATFLRAGIDGIIGLGYEPSAFPLPSTFTLSYRVVGSYDRSFAIIGLVSGGLTA